MNNENLKKYKNIHQGKRVFLIGNGPSLSKTNLDLIKDEYSIAMCRISLIYPKTSWRPSYYVFASSNCKDKRWGKEWTDSVLNSVKENKTKSFIWEKYHEHFDKKNEYKNITWIKNITEKKPNSNGDYEESWWPENIEERMDKSGTSMNLALQLANYMGFSEIIFLGTDLGYSVQKTLNDDPNHFLGSYNAEIVPEKVNKINNQMANVHRLARMRIPPEIKMYNATITTQLDVYPKICFETLMKHNQLKPRLMTDNYQYIQKHVEHLSEKDKWNHKYNLDGIITIENQKKSIGNNEIKWQRIKKYVNFKNKKVLDLACADGYFSVQSLLSGAKYVNGIDLDEQRIEKANFIKSIYNFQSIDFNIQDVYKMNLEKESYDIILCLGLLHRIPDINKLIKKISSSSSLLIIESKIFESEESILKKGPQDTKSNKLNILYHIPSYKYLENQLKENGYNNVIFDIHPKDRNNYKRGLLICSKD